VNIPRELRERRQWVQWASIERGGKATKVPKHPSGSMASSTDPTTWSGFSEVGGQIGFVFSTEDPYIGIDLDGCRNMETGKLDDWAKEIVLRCGTYGEVSPSGSGVKLFGVTDAIWNHKNKVELPGDGYGPKKPGIEIYDCGRYFAVTGQRLQGMDELIDVTGALEWLVEKYDMKQQFAVIDGSGVTSCMSVVDRASKYVAKMEPAVSGSGGHNALFAAACALLLGFELSESEAYNVLAVEFNPRCSPPWSERDLRYKCKSAAKQPGQRGYLRDAQPEQWSKIVVRTPPQDMDEREPPKVTTLQSASLAYLDSLEAGTEALLQTGIPELTRSIGGGFAWGEMVIVAARPSHGKSAIGLQMVHAFTEAGQGVLVVSEEMSSLAIGKRTIQFAADTPEDEWLRDADDVRAQIESHFAHRAEAIIAESCGTVERVVEQLEIAADSGIKIAVIDYVQLLQSKGRDETERVANASKALRRIATQRGMILIVLTQLNRNIESRKEFRPCMSDLKQSGQLEQDADVIIFGVWPHRINSSTPSELYQLFVGKNRNRSIVEPAIEVSFDGARQKLMARAIAAVDFNTGEYEQWTDNY